MRAGTREAIILTFNNSEAVDGSVDSRETGHSDTDSGDTENPRAGGTTTEQAVEPDKDLAAQSPQTPAFADFDVQPEIIRALHDSGIENTFAIQELTLPLALRGDDLIGQARTGTGKTLGFGVPLLNRLTAPGDGTPQALVVVPTRELCLQVTRDLTDAAKHLGVRTLAIYGGRPYEEQTSELKKGVDLVIGTPGRLLDLAEQQQLVLGKVRGLVLDEADEMLDLGFLPDIERILTMVPDQRQTMLFSATMPGPIITLARKFLQQPTHIRAEEVDAGATHERTRQLVYRAHAMDKTEMLTRVLQARERGLTMIFARTKRTAQRLSDDLAERGFAAAAVHGDLGQGAREQALRAFRSGKVDTLVATDVAARGIDVPEVTHVINLQCPEDEKNYVHRIGRTGRAGLEGVAVTLVDWDEEQRWKLINDALGLDKPDPVETYSTSAHLYEELNIPTDATGRLPLSQRTRAGLDAEPDEGGKDTGGKGRKRGRRSGNPDASTGSHAGGSNGDGRREGGESRPGGRRKRRRTRGGVNSEAPTDGMPAAAAATAAGAPTATAEPASSGNGEGGGNVRRRRRRRRGGSGGGSGSADAE